MNLSDAFLLVGFGLAVAGVYLLAGAGCACLFAGVVLFAAGGLDRRGR